METAKIAVDSCYVLQQFLTPLPSINFREIRGLVKPVAKLAQALKYRSVTDIVRPIREIVRRREETTRHSVQPK